MDQLVDLVWLIPALPLAGFLILLVAGRRLGEPTAGWVATAACFGSFAATIAVFLGLTDLDAHHRVGETVLFDWLVTGGWTIEMGFLADPLSLTMALFVTGIGGLIHLYAIGYMHGDANFSKFFIYLNLFVFSMLMLVLGKNLLVTFLGWEGVGACSYWLISFWFTSEANASAGKKAFVTNRIGDWGFLVAMALTLGAIGSLDYADLNAAATLTADGAPGGLAAVTATGIALMLFVGAVGKSAQLPLFVWLPDAMAGPTPVSALIHAATMVTAGVFLMTRVSPVLEAAYDWGPTIIAWVGVITALVAATIAVAQNDIKKVLAYSTVSQLGFMFLAIGTGAFVAAIFHMVTHAFFKALMFLGAGSVIHGMHDEQDMRRMGGLQKLMPITAGTFVVGWLAIAGVPPFSGFWSKDEILLFSWEQNTALFAVGMVAALLTAYYMSRLVFMTFFGAPRWAAADTGAEASLSVSDTDRDGGTVEAVEHAEAADEHADAADGHAEIHPHESPWQMTVPLVVLAGLALVGGGLNLPFSSDTHFLETWLHPVVEVGEYHLDASGGTKLMLAIGATVVALLGVGAAALVYLRKRLRPVEPAVLAHGWYLDEGVTWVAGGPGRAAFEGTATFDKVVVDGAVNGIAGTVKRLGGLLRTTQTGFVRSYALGITTGVVVLLAYFLTRLFV